MSDKATGCLVTMICLGMVLFVFILRIALTVAVVGGLAYLALKVAGVDLNGGGL